MSEPIQPPNPSQLMAAAHNELQALLSEYGDATTQQVRDKLAPRLVVASLRESSTLILGSAELLRGQMQGLGLDIKESTRVLGQRIDAFGVSSDKTAGKLARYTLALAIATAFLVVATFGLIWAEFHSDTPSPQVIVVPPMPPPWTR